MYVKFPLSVSETLTDWSVYDSSQTPRLVSSYSKNRMGPFKSRAYARAYCAMSNREREIFTD